MMDISLALNNHEREAQREAMEKTLIKSEQFKNAILTAALDCIISLNPEGEIIHVNQAAESTFGYRSADITGRKFVDIIIPPEWRSQCQQDMAQFLATGESAILNRRIELNAMHANGSLFPVELAIVPIDVHGNRIFTAFIRDITARKRDEEVQAGQHRILNMVATGAGLSDILNEIALFIEAQSGRASCAIQLLDPNGARLCTGAAPGLPDEYRRAIDGLPVAASHGSCSTAVLRAKPVIVTDIASDPLWEDCRETALQHGFKAYSSWPIIGKNRTSLGTIALYFHEATTPAANELRLFDICANLAGIAIDSRASEERIRYLAHYDGLTCLPNRFLFQEFLDLALRNAQRHLKKFAVFFLDLDKFKEINDTYGHEAGDQVLQEVAMRFRHCVRQCDKIARMGGDEFYVLIEDLEDGRHAADVAQKLLEEAARPVQIGGNTCQLSASIGISIYPDDGCSAQALLKNADDAMYYVKHGSRNAYQFHAACQQKSC